MGLNDDLTGVTPSSPDGKGDQSNATPGQEPGQQTSGAMGDRTDENLQREFTRKIDDMGREFRQELARMQDRNQQLLQEVMKTKDAATQQPQSPVGAATHVSETAVGNEPAMTQQYSTTQLNQMLTAPGIKPEQSQVITQALSARTQTAAAPPMQADPDAMAKLVRGVIQEEDHKRTSAAFDATSKQEAVDRYPILSEKNSDFNIQVERELDSMRAVRGTVGGDILDAANRVAGRLGLAPKLTTRLHGGYSAPGSSSAPAQQPEGGEFALSDERYDEIARALKGGMPTRDGKKVEFNKERIMNNSRELDMNTHLFGIARDRGNK